MEGQDAGPVALRGVQDRSGQLGVRNRRLVELGLQLGQLASRQKGGVGVQTILFLEKEVKKCLYGQKVYTLHQSGSNFDKMILRSLILQILIKNHKNLQF